jgi:hypothetical protein
VKRRLVFYGALLAALVSCVAFATGMPGSSYRGPLPPPSPEERALAVALEAHVVALSETIGERRVGRGDSLGQARDYALSVIREISGVHESQVRREDVGAEGYHAENIVIDIAGETPNLVVVGAHYDSAAGAPGADDNASGVATTLELLKRFAGQRSRKTLRFVLFANEEAPYFQDSGMGSLSHARNVRLRGDSVDAMLSLESLGYYSDAPGSQRYPWPIGLFYPERGDFLAFVGNLGSRSLVRDSIATFRSAVQFPSEGAALPATIPGVGWSDHWAFWENGYEAVMVTDTAPYRNPHYHEHTDVAASIDYTKLARVTVGLRAVVNELATRN